MCMQSTLSPEKVNIITSPAIENWLSILRKQETDMRTFRETADNIALAIGIELAKQLPTKIQTIHTPIAPMQAKFIESKQILLIAILRSAYPLCVGIKKALPHATISIIDVKRDEETALPTIYYDGLPQSLASFDKIIIPDPMFATGGSISVVLDLLLKKGAKNIQFISLVAAPEGIERIHNNYPNVAIATCAIDKELNAKKYIVPGLGDFGDRYFGNEPLSIEDTSNKKLLDYKNGRVQINNLEI